MKANICFTANNFPDAIITFFSRTFRKGMMDLKVWPDEEANPQINSTTPGKTKDSNDQMSRLAKVKTCINTKLFHG